MRQPHFLEKGGTAPQVSGSATTATRSNEESRGERPGKADESWHFTSWARDFVAGRIPMGYEDDQGFHYGSGNPFAE